MAKKTIYLISDDLDGSTGDVRTVRFGVNGTAYEIDLSAQNLEKFEAALAPYIDAARRMPNGIHRQANGGRAPRRTSRATTKRNAAIRNWWFTADWHQLELPQPRRRGSIPSSVRTAYDEAHPGDAPRHLTDR
ncbi:histone-like nucleoid-structuring protein Lsr2 [Plantactinospora sp. CA-290183]|uniref:histone-like nucleoid-structuring protein Lsr2 n=1 Tax=Plantactinospora sp. CA-290183 TaxID=3240006 RepID=UPI003D8AC65B